MNFLYQKVFDIYPWNIVLNSINYIFFKIIFFFISIFNLNLLILLKSFLFEILINLSLLKILKPLKGITFNLKQSLRKLIF